MRSLSHRAVAYAATDTPDDAELGALLEAMRPPRGIAAMATFDSSGAPAIASTGRSITAELFELGSVTKTITATALAQMVLDGNLSLDTSVGEILGPTSGGAAGLTLFQLATHTSGLPKLAPNAMRLPFWPRDPYRFYDEKRLWRGLADIEVVDQGKFRYSNVGYALLGVCLAHAAKTPIAEVLTETVMKPAGMATARCQPCPRSGLVRGNGHWLTAGRRWHQPLPGAGGIDGSIADLAAWTSANRTPESTALRGAVQLAQCTHHEEEKVSIGLAWIKTDGTIWHNGATGGYSSFIGLAGERAICALASLAPTREFNLDPHAMRYLKGPPD